MEIIQHKLIRGCSPVLVVKKQNIFRGAGIFLERTLKEHSERLDF